MSKFDRGYIRSLLKKELGELWQSEKIQKSADLCFDSHQGQFRESADSSSAKIPYVLHPVGVALLCNQFFEAAVLSDSREVIIMAALLHDVLEDTKTKSSDITTVCGERTTEIVSILTKPQILPNETNQDRNRRFQELITQGGSSPMFVKICDSMHNLSRPNQSPLHLMKKAIKKGRGDYAKFFRSGLDHNDLEDAYFDRIQKTATYIAAGRLVDEDQPNSSLTALLDKAFELYNQKALEVHDLLDFSENEMLCTFARSMRKDRIIEEICSAEGKINSQTQKFIFDAISSGELSIERLPKKVHNVPLLSDIDRLLFFPLDSLLGDGNSSDYCLVLGLNHASSPSWLDFTTASVVLKYLSEKTRAFNQRELIELSRSASNLGLDLTTEELAVCDIHYSQLLELRDLLRDCEYLRGYFVNAISNKIDRIEAITLPLPLESRVKEPSSVLSKMSRRKYRSFSELDDLLGLRIICKNISQRKKVRELCEDVVLSFDGGAVTKDNVTFEEIKTAAGYKANHMRFVVKSPFSSHLDIGCEIQVRTIFEDSWARLSASVDYKSEKRRKSNSSILKKLAKLRDEAEELSNRLY